MVKELGYELGYEDLDEIDRFSFTDIPRYIQRLLRYGSESMAIRLAIARGARDENKLTNMVFFARYPGRHGRRLNRHERELAREWLDIRNRLVRPALRAISTRRAPAAPTGVPALGGPKVPQGFRKFKRRGVIRGLARYGGGRLDRKLLSLRTQGVISVSERDIDTFQRIANVETSGLVQGINTWDSAVVSSGFMQWTLQHGKLQEWIKMAEVAFQRYGIALDNRTYKWYSRRRKRTEEQQAIKGAATKDELRWNGWAERFYLAGLDTEIIAAEVQLAGHWLQRQLNGLKSHLRRKNMVNEFATFKAHYDRSPQVRGIFQAAYNNLPAAAKDGTISALRRDRAAGGVSTERFLKTFQDAILKAYAARDDDGTRIITETRRGARFD